MIGTTQEAGVIQWKNAASQARRRRVDTRPILHGFNDSASILVCAPPFNLGNVARTLLEFHRSMGVLDVNASQPR